MLSPAESGFSERRYACAWLEERMRITRDLAAAAAHDPNQRAVHDARVACRRLREAIAFFQHSGVPSLGDVDRAARRMARAVSRLRETDVARDRLRTLELPEGPAFAELLATLAVRRDALVRRKATRIARRARQLANAVQAQLPLLPATSSGRVGAEGEAELKVTLAGRVDRREREVERLWADIAARDPREITSDQLHDVRVAVKHWRYAAEISRAVVPRAEYQALSAKLRRLQRTGGKSQDWSDVSAMVAKLYRKRKLTSDERELQRAVVKAYAKASRAFMRTLKRDLPSTSGEMTSVGEMPRPRLLLAVPAQGRQRRR